MSRKVIADTGPLYAAVDPDDQYHDRAQQQLQELEAARRTVVLLYPTMLEAYTLVLYRLGTKTAQGWLNDVLAGVSVLNPTSTDYRDAAALTARFPDQSISLFDAVVATVALRSRMHVWTFDHHFDVMRTDVWR